MFFFKCNHESFPSCCMLAVKYTLKINPICIKTKSKMNSQLFMLKLIKKGFEWHYQNDWLILLALTLNHLKHCRSCRLWSTYNVPVAILPTNQIDSDAGSYEVPHVDIYRVTAVLRYLSQASEARSHAESKHQQGLQQLSCAVDAGIEVHLWGERHLQIAKRQIIYTCGDRQGEKKAVRVTECFSRLKWVLTRLHEIDQCNAANECEAAEDESMVFNVWKKPEKCAMHLYSAPFTLASVKKCCKQKIFEKYK